MLKTRLIFLLCATILLIALAEMFALFLLRDHVASFDRVVGKDFEALLLVNDFRTYASDLEAKYLPLLALESGYAPTENEMLIRLKSDFEASLEQLTTLTNSDVFSPDHRNAVESLNAAVLLYLTDFGRVFESGTAELPVSERLKLRSRILNSSYAMSDRVDQTLDLLEASVLEENRQTVIKSQRTLNLLWGIGVVLLIGAVVGYFLFAKKIIQPVAHLRESIREIQQQNFEQILPVKSADEIGQLAAAFNDMSAELRVMKLQSDQEVARLNRERSAILQGFPHPIFILGKKGEMSQANPSAISLMEGLVGEKEDLPKKITERVRHCVETGEDFLPDEINHAMLLRIREREFWYLPRIFKIFVEDEATPDGWAVVLIDVTRVRWLDDVKSDMLGTVSHEIKTPLTSIRMILHLLAEQKTGDLNSTQEKMVFSARDDCERLLTTLEELLQLSRMESNRNSLDITSQKPAQMLSDAVESISGEGSGAQVKVKISETEELPNVLADRKRIGQVIGHLLSNALKHSPKDSQVVVSAAKERSDFVRFSVSDQGKGIPESEQRKIFDQFYRGNDSENEGTGVGLWIAREVVRAHNGSIGVKSSPGSPTEFYFDLPVSQT